MASGFGKIVVGTYVEIKRSDGKFKPFSAPFKLFGIFVVRYSSPCSCCTAAHLRSAQKR